MDKNAHYLIVGLFVILATIAGVMFGGWLYNGNESAESKQFEVQFSESVDGLSKGNEVRYMGIRVGEVEETYLLDDQPNKVGVIISINANTPILDNTVATLRTQGVTGLAYINLVPQKARPRQQTAPIIGDGKYDGNDKSQSELPIINSAPSEFGGLIHALPDLQDRLSQLIGSANQALNQENIKNFSAILENIDHLVIDANKVFTDENLNNLAAILENLNQTAQDGSKLIADLRKTNKNLNRLVTNMDQLVGSNKTGLKNSISEFQRTMENVSSMTQRYSQLAVKLNKMVTTNEEQINTLIADGGDDLKQLLIESKRTATTVRRLAEKLEQNPSQIFYESSSEGVEIPQ